MTPTTKASGTAQSVATPTGSAIVLVLVSTVAFAMKGLLAKYVYATGMTVDGLLLLRFLIAMPFFWVGVYLFGKRRPGDRPMRARDLLWGLLYGGLFFASAVGDFTAVSLINVSISRIVLFTFPAIVLILECLHKRRLPPMRQVVCFVVTYIGLMLVLAPDGFGQISPTLWNGAVWALGSALTYSFYLYFGQRMIGTIGSMHFAALVNTMAGLCMIVYQLVLHKPLNLTVDGVTWTVLIAIFCTVIPFFLLYEGIRRIGATQAALISLSGPAMTLCAAWLLLGEVLSPIQMAGFAVVVIGVASIKNGITLAGAGRLLARPFFGARNKN
ncbi:DMT family transporter [Thalassospira sp. MA62]|nr:DMT family transporter [Thalassospira sp. MA62]